MAVEVGVRVAAPLFWFNGLGFGLPCLYGIQSLARGRGVPLLFGFPSYGGGVFERFGVKTTVPLLLAFFLVCMLEVFVGFLVWFGRLDGALLGLVLLPAGAVFWIGFSLPVPPVSALIRTALVIAYWRSFSG